VKLFIYFEQCTMAGHSVPERIVQEHEDPDNAGDWFTVEGTEAELEASAREWIGYVTGIGAGTDRYRRRVARTILEALAWSKENIDRAIYGTCPTFTREQVAFVADKILSAAFDRIEACIPDTIPLAEYDANREGIGHSITAAMDTAAMALAILFAQTTGEGMGVWDWAGSEEFRGACESFIAERTRPDWPGLKAGEPCYTDTTPFAEMFADEWQETRGD